MSTNDPEFYQTPKFSPEQHQAPPHQRGCFFYGCIIASVLALLMVILVAVIGYLGYRWLNQMVETYTATVPETLPTVGMPAEKRKELKDRVEAFRKAVNEEAAIEPLVLTGDDLNALIEENEEFKGTVYFKVEGDQLKGRISFPLDKLKLPLTMVKGRFLNGEADLKASLFDGELIVHLEALEVNGKKVPDQMMTDIRKQNVAKDVAKDQKTAEMLRKIQSLEIKDGKIILKVRAKSGATGGVPSTKTAVPVEVVPSGASQPKSDASKNGEPQSKAAVEPVPDQPVPKKAG